jgi:hypothetical protein
MGYGATVIAKLLNTPVKKNLFFTIKDRVIEERPDGPRVTRRIQKTKVYGSDSNHAERERLIEILRERVEYHKDKIVSQTIYDELCGMEVKKNGRVEHSNTTHDDQVFSWLWALYVYYEGNDLMNMWGIEKHVLKTDQNLEEAVYDIETPGIEISNEIEIQESDDVQEQLDILRSAPGNYLRSEWDEYQRAQEQACLAKILSTPLGRKAYEETYHTDLDNSDIGIDGSYRTQTIPNSVFEDFYRDEYEEEAYRVLQGSLSHLW